MGCGGFILGAVVSSSASSSLGSSSATSSSCRLVGGSRAVVVALDSLSSVKETEGEDAVLGVVDEKEDSSAGCCSNWSFLGVSVGDAVLVLVQVCPCSIVLLVLVLVLVLVVLETKNCCHWFGDKIASNTLGRCFESTRNRMGKQPMVLLLLLLLFMDGGTTTTTSSSSSSSTMGRRFPQTSHRRFVVGFSKVQIPQFQILIALLFLAVFVVVIIVDNYLQYSNGWIRLFVCSVG